MKEQLENEIANMLIQYVTPEALDVIKMRLTMILKDYSVTQEERALAIYEEDETGILLRRFLAAKIAKGLSPRTITYYKNSLEATLRVIGKPYDAVTADDIRYYLAMRVQRDGVTKTTANNERRCLSSFYDWLHVEEIITRNPMRKVEAMKETKKKKSAFSQMDLEKMRAACRTSRETALIETLISSWARVSEVVAIRIDELHGEQVTVLGKGDKERICYLTPKAQLAIARYLDERSDENPYLFPRAKFAGDVVKAKRNAAWYKCADMVDETRHMDVGSVEGIVRSIGKRAGVTKAHPHRFRRTGATMALRSGMPLIQVSKLLGHNSVETTQIYLDITDAELMAAHGRYVN